MVSARMAVSASRTLAVTAQPTSQYAGGPYLQWPYALPGGNLDYSLNVAQPISEVSDVIAIASVSLAPSGTGEMQVVSVSVSGDIVTARLADGYPGRTYTAKILVTGESGRVWEFLAAIPVAQDITVSPYLSPPSSGFGPPSVWLVVASRMLRFNQALNSFYLGVV